jgi:hypothetical protein
MALTKGPNFAHERSKKMVSFADIIQAAEASSRKAFIMDALAEIGSAVELEAGFSLWLQGWRKKYGVVEYEYSVGPYISPIIALKLDYLFEIDHRQAATAWRKASS